MSYTIVKHIASVKGDDGKYHIKGRFADSSIRPLYYYDNTSVKGYDTKVEADAFILMDYENGHCRGASRYEKFLDECRNDVYPSEVFPYFIKAMRLKYDGVWGRYTIDGTNKKSGAKRNTAYLTRLNNRLYNNYKKASFRLAKEFESWKPNTDKYVIVFNKNKIVTDGTDKRCRCDDMYFYGETDKDWVDRAKKFSKLKAIKMVNAYKSMNAEMVKVN